MNRNEFIKSLATNDDFQDKCKYLLKGFEKHFYTLSEFQRMKAALIEYAVDSAKANGELND